MHRTVVVLCLLAVTACYRDTPVAPSPINQELTLAPGEVGAINGVGLSLTFIGVSGDSRCPADALCVTGGSASVRVEALATTGARREITFATGNPQPVSVGSLTLEFVQLAPYPFSTTPIQPQDYRATIRARR